MLLKQLQYSNKHKPAAQPAPVFGTFQTKEKRTAHNRETRAAHFQLGNQDMPFKPVSTAQEQFGSTAVADQSLKKESETLRKAARQSHFSIGKPKNPVFYNETSTKCTYTNQVANVSKSQADAPNLRKSNFAVGSDKLDYSTTTREVQNNFSAQMKDVNPLQEAENKKQAQKERVQNARAAQFKYGNDAVNYDSIAKQTFGEKDLTQSKETREQRANNGKDLRKSHFSFGNDQHVRGGNSFQPSFNPVDKVPATQTNVKLHHTAGPAAGPLGSARFESTYRSGTSQHVQPVKLGADTQVVQRNGKIEK